MSTKRLNPSASFVAKTLRKVPGLASAYKKEGVDKLRGFMTATEMLGPA
jgi:hypothetical protein